MRMKSEALKKLPVIQLNVQLGKHLTATARLYRVEKHHCYRAIVSRGVTKYLIH